MEMPAHHPCARRRAAKTKVIQARRPFYAAIKAIDTLIGVLPTAFDVPMNERAAMADEIERAVAPFVEAAALLPKDE